MGELFGRDKPLSDLAWTGERLTGGAGMQVELEHLHRYFLARDLARGLDVLDVASGEGYGAALLAQTARKVIGVDNDHEAIAHAARSYVLPNLRFLAGDTRRLPIGDDSIDLVVSFETIEHLREQDEAIGEIRRVLRPDGRLLISTPERDAYSATNADANPFHVRELTRDEFVALLGRHFAHVSLVGQRPLLGSAIFPESIAPGGLLTFEQRDDGRYEASPGLPRAVYLLALASARDIGTMPASLYIRAGSVEESLAAALRTETDRHAADLDAERRSAREEIERISRRAEDERAAAEAELRGMIERHRSTEVATEGHLQALLSRADALGAKLDRLVQHQDESAARRRDRAAESARQPDDRDLRLARLEDHRRHVERENARAVRALAEAKDYARHLESELAAQRVRGDHLGNQLISVLSSRLWQSTAPLRRLASASPLLRRGLHGLSAALPWVKREAPAAPAPPPQEPRPAATADPEVEDPDDPDRTKAALTGLLSADLAAFLAGSDRIVFRKARGDETPAVSVLIVLWNKAHFTLRCLRSLAAVQDEATLEIIIVDNASSDDTSRLLGRVDGAKIVRNPTNAGFLLATNQAAGMAGGETLLLLNNDAFPRPGAIRAARETLRSGPDIGAVGGLIILPSGLVQEGGSIVWSDGSTYGYGRGLSPDCGEVRFRRDVSYVSGAFLLTPRDRWEALGGFDEAFAPAYYEDTDYCMRLGELGLRVVFEPRAVVDHYELGSQAKSGDAVEASLRNRGAFRERHAAALASLPAPALDNPLRARDQIAGRSKRLLIVDDLVPLGANGSGMPRLRAIIAAAVAGGWSVTCYTMHDPAVDWEAIWRELPAGVEVIATRGAAELGAFFAERPGHYRAILVSRPHNMPPFWAAVGSHHGALGRARVVYDAEAIFAARRIAMLALEGVEVDRGAGDAMIADEIEGIAAGVRAVTCVTAEDRELFRRFLPPGIPVHRVGHAVYVSKGTPPHGARRGFLFVGRLMEREAPNWQGLAWFVEKVWPSIRRALPNAELTVVGRLHPAHEALSAPGVHLAGPVDDLEAAYDRARVFVAPVRFAAGIPIKIIEATAAGLPTACTTLMARQLDWPAEEALAASDDPAELARLAVALHEDADAWQTMVDQARRCLARDFGAEAFAASLGAALGGHNENDAPARSTATSW